MRHSEQFHSITPAPVLCPMVPSQIVPSLSPKLLTAVSIAAPIASLHRSLFGHDASKHWTLHGLLHREFPFRISVGVSACCFVVLLSAVA
jgi:hypothetical protein